MSDPEQEPESDQVRSALFERLTSKSKSRAGRRTEPEAGPVRPLRDLIVVERVEDEEGLPGTVFDVGMKVRVLDDGTLVLAEESEAVLRGQDLSALVEEEPTGKDEKEFDDPDPDDFYSAQGAADRLGVDKSTITRKIKRNELLGFRGFKRDWLIPKAQFAARRRRPIPGVTEMIERFHGDHEEAWSFLTARVFYGDSLPRPIDRLEAVAPRDEAGLKDCLESLEAARKSFEFGDPA